MKFPSIFRSAKPMRFDIQPRYYDPIKEDIDQRTAKIRRQLEAEGIISSEEQDMEMLRRDYGASSLRGAFTKGSPIKKSPSAIFDNAGMLRTIIFILLVGGVFGYLYYGNLALYIMLYTSLTILGLVFLFRLRGRSPK
ncbi:hypothetical protein [Pararhodonellum marinum]|uniref:hypothetical protein n=1 Tax=Pararhodonellum marinum TaxID=2755358 RepID=UPI00188FD0B0|nr:hypothetical protein [Pararhodonellum marinum]